MHAKWEQMHRQVEEAVSRGEMTREEADAKHQRIRDRMEADHGE